jgi:hypothetical protein
MQQVRVGKDTQNIILPKTLVDLTNYFSTDIVFPFIHDAFVVQVPNALETDSEVGFPPSWLTEYGQMDLSQCTTSENSLKRLIHQCDATSSLVQVGKKRYAKASTPRSLGFAVGYEQMEKFSAALYSTPTYAPPSYLTNGVKWWGIPIESSSPFMESSTLGHWDFRYANQTGSPEKLFGMALHPLSLSNPPLFAKDGPFLGKTYLNSGYGPSIVAALYTLGYPIKGLERTPMEGIVIKYQMRPSKIRWWVLVLSVLGGVGLLAGLFVLYRRRVRRAKLDMPNAGAPEKNVEG